VRRREQEKITSTGFAERILNHEYERDSEPAGRVVILPTFSIIAYPPLTAAVLNLLDDCAEEDALDQVARYELTRESVAALRGKHAPVRDVVRQLEVLGGQEFPGNVRTTLLDWERQADRLSLHRDAMVLRVDDEAVIDDILRDASVGRWVRRLTPTAAIIQSEGMVAIRLWLVRRGHLPSFRSMHR